MSDFGALFLKWWPKWAAQRERIARLEEVGRAQAATIGRQAVELARLKTHLSRSLSAADGLQAYAATLERKFILPPPSGGLSLPEADITQHLPLPLTTRENSRATVLPLAEWERFAAWAVPRVRNIRPYEPNVYDCGNMTRMLLGLAEEWVPGLACGWIELTSPRDILHKMVWLLALKADGIVVLRYIDATPRGTVTLWPEGVFSDIGQWTIDRIGF